jgi:hydrogenase/urease accessory protein HupE
MGAITRTKTFTRGTRRGQLLQLASCVAVGAAIALAGTVRLLAHDPGLSVLDIRIEQRQIVAVLSLASGDAAMVGGGDAFSKLTHDALQLSLDGRPISPSATSIRSDESGGLHGQMLYDRTAGSHLVVRSTIVGHLARGHRELLSIRAPDGVVLSERMLDAASSEVATDISVVGGATSSSAARFLLLGVEHILTGYDHLLFLAGVLVVVRRWRDVVQTITAFTVAHSLTLALATTGLLLIPGRIVEPLIAASIVYVGIENLMRNVHGSRWTLTFGFGLVHGLGFATVLRDLGIGTNGHGAIALPLASFNAGVEVGQMAVAVLLVPVFWWLAARPTTRLPFAAAWSVMVITAGSYWLVERIV